MPNVRREEEPNGAAKRAAEVNESFLGVPGYADDSMLSIIRYGDQRSLRQCDFDEFIAEVNALSDAAEAPAEDFGSAAAKAEKVTEHRQKALAKIEGFPELLAGFETMIVNSRAVRRTLKASPK